MKIDCFVRQNHQFSQFPVYLGVTLDWTSLQGAIDEGGCQFKKHCFRWTVASYLNFIQSLQQLFHLVYLFNKIEWQNIG